MFQSSVFTFTKKLPDCFPKGFFSHFLLHYVTYPHIPARNKHSKSFKFLPILMSIILLHVTLICIFLISSGSLYTQIQLSFLVQYLSFQSWLKRFFSCSLDWTCSFDVSLRCVDICEVSVYVYTHTHIYTNIHIYVL